MDDFDVAPDKIGESAQPSTFVPRLTTQMRDNELREERLRERLQLPERR